MEVKKKYELNKYKDILIAIILGLLAFGLCYGFSVLDVTWDEWLFMDTQSVIICNIMLAGWHLETQNGVGH